MRRLSRGVGCTEGQAYTLVIGVMLAAGLLVGTVPAVRNRPASIGGDSSIALKRLDPVAPATGLAAPNAGSPESPTDDSALSPTLPPSPSDASGRRPTPAPAAGDPEPPAAESLPPAGGDAAAAPLTVSEAGWATAGSATPAARAGVPPGTLPVAAGADGSTTRRSFVRLQGAAPVLSLRVRTDPGATFNDATAAVSACAITDPGWVASEAMALDQAPPFDALRCARGSRQGDGSWRFDLAGFADRAGRAGFTLVPDPTHASGPFQVAFDPAPGGPS